MRREALLWAQRVCLVIVAVVALLAGYALLSEQRQPTDSPAAPTPTPSPSLLSTSQPIPTAAAPKKVGIVAGHWQFDSGAICPDGLQEVEVNLPIARRVVDILLEAGYDAELLAEYDPKLYGYQADALVSLHADSCDVPGASGFKVARITDSFIPEIEDRLVECLVDAYGRRTGLHYHENSITPHMRGYHAFVEIAPETPGAIVEMGFMRDDRWLLVGYPDRVARGIVDGIVRFLEGE